MAQFYPEDLAYSNPTASERTFYNALKNQLGHDDEYTIFYSVPWLSKNNKNKHLIKGEADFIICHEDYGFIVLEVKGGSNLTFPNGKYELIEMNGDKRTLKTPPDRQASKNSYYFRDLISSRTKKKFYGIAGYSVVFPNFHIKEDLSPNCPLDIIISINDFNDLPDKIENIIKYWQNSQNHFSVKESKKLVDILLQEKAYKFSYQSKIYENEKKLEEINKIQDSLLDFLTHYDRASITGGAGTGKTWIAVKKAIRELQQGKTVLYVCFNRSLADFIDNKFAKNYDNFYSKTFHQLCEDIIGAEEFKKFYDNNELTGISDTIFDIENIKKYDSIIIDEGQDFTDEWGLVLTTLLNDEENGLIYLFLDKEQDIFGRKSISTFMTESPAYLLTKNIRNTKQICEWCKKETGFGTSMNANFVEGVEPVVIESNNKDKLRKEVGKILYDLINEHGIDTNQIVILSDTRMVNSIFKNNQSVGNFKITNKEEKGSILYKTIQSFKGLESDVVIYLQHKHDKPKLNYVGYTRSKYVLYVLKFIQ
jgi:DNA helicase IV